MQLVKVDPRLLKENPDRTRQSKSSAQADALMLATIQAVGIVQPPVVESEKNGGNGYIIDAGHRRVRLAIAAGLEEINVLVEELSNDNGAMRLMVENIAREPLNPVDQWRGIERLMELDWTEDTIAVALALPVRQIKKLRLLAKLLPAMLDQIALGDMPNEQQLRTIAAASIDEQSEVWKANKPKKGDTAQWWSIANALNRKRMYAKDASFGDDLSAAYGIEWVEDLFAPANEDSRYTTNVEAFLGAQHEWMTNNLPKKGSIVEANTWGRPDLPKKAEQVHGKPQKSDHTAMYLDRDGKVKTVHYRLPEANKSKGKNAATAGSPGEVDEEPIAGSKPRPDVTQNGLDMIGDYRTDALHDALGRAPIEDDMLMALLVLAFAGLNIRVDLGADGTFYSGARFKRHAASLFDQDGKLTFDIDTLRVTARSVLIDVLSCRRNNSNSGVISRVVGDAIGADAFLPNMGTEAFLACLSRQALEASCKGTPVHPKTRVRETRAALVEQFKEGHFVHPAALFTPDPKELADLIKHAEASEQDEPGSAATPATSTAAGTDAGVPDPDPQDGEGDAEIADAAGDDAPDEDESAFGIAAE
jgi:ParB family chromosome partitioning protein